MPVTVRSKIRQAVNTVLSPAGVELVSRSRALEDYRAYIPWKRTIDEARAAGLSVGDYIDQRHNVPGATKRTLDEMTALGVFAGRIDRVCEIGPGSGRYLDRTKRAASPSYYEIYETADDWGEWLVETFGVVRQPSDGRSLGATPDGSIDLVHAHKVLPGQPSLVVCRYLMEMARVSRPGSKIVFDAVTEASLDEATLEQWLASGSSYQHYPCLVPRQYMIDLLARRGCRLDGSFQVPMKPGYTECFVFTKTGDPQPA